MTQNKEEDKLQDEVQTLQNIVGEIHANNQILRGEIKKAQLEAKQLCGNWVACDGHRQDKCGRENRQGDS